MTGFCWIAGFMCAFGLLTEDFFLFALYGIITIAIGFQQISDFQKISKNKKGHTMAKDNINLINKWAKGIMDDALDALDYLDSDNKEDRRNAKQKIGEIIGACEIIIETTEGD